MTPLCPLEEIDGAKGFSRDGSLFFLVRQGDAVFAYVNRCPHLGIPLEWTPDVFLSRDGRHIQCSTHGARFRIEDGHCITGPCSGDELTAVAVTVRDGTVFLG